MCRVEFDIVCKVSTRSRMFSRWMDFRFKMQVQNPADGFQVQKIGSKLVCIKCRFRLDRFRIWEMDFRFKSQV